MPWKLLPNMSQQKFLSGSIEEKEMMNVGAAYSSHQCQNSGGCNAAKWKPCLRCGKSSHHSNDCTVLARDLCCDNCGKKRAFFRLCATRQKIISRKKVMFLTKESFQCAPLLPFLLDKKEEELHHEVMPRLNAYFLSWQWIIHVLSLSRHGRYWLHQTWSHKWKSMWMKISMYQNWLLSLANMYGWRASSQ